MKSQNTSTNGTSLKKTVKAVRVFSILLLFILFGSVSAFAQAVGDYRSAVVGNWATRGNWQRWDGSAWVAPTAGQGYPGQNASPTTVTIRNGFNIILNVSVANAIGNLVVGDGSGGNLETDNTARTITVNTSLTVNANSTLGLEAMTITNNGTTNVYGSLTDISTTGANIFVGLFRVYNGGSFTLTSGETCEFRGGIINDGTFSKTGAGAITFSTNNQSISGSGTITMNGAITVSAGVTVTNNSTNLNLTSTANPAITGTGTWRQGANSVLNTQAASINITTFDCSTNINTVNFSRNGAQTIPAITYHNLTASVGNTKTAAGNITVNGNLTVSAGALAFGATAATVNVTGNLSGAGTINMSGNAGHVLNLNGATNAITTLTTLAGNTINYNRAGDQTVFASANYRNLTISGSGVKTLQGNATIGGNLTISAGTFDFGTTARTVSVTGNLSGAGTLDMSGGSALHTLNLGGATNAIGTFTTAAVASTINYNRAGDQTVFAANNYRNLTISGSGIKTLQGNSTIGGNLSVSAGTLDLGAVVTSLDVSGTAAIAGILSYNGTTTKTVNITGNLSGAGTINMSGGSLLHTLNLGGATNAITTLTTAAVASVINYNRAGDQTVFTNANYRNLTISGSGTKTLQGNSTINNLLLDAGTFSLGTVPTTVAISGFASIAGTLAFGGTSTKALSIGGVLSGTGTIDMSGGSLLHTLNLSGAVNSIGTLTTAAVASTINYNRAGDQTVFASANYRNLTISGSGVKTLQGNSTIGGNLSVSVSTLDLGTVVTNLDVLGTAAISGILLYNGTTTKTVSITGNLSGIGTINMSGGSLLHTLNLGGATNTITTFTTAAVASTVNYNRAGDQTMFASLNYRNLTISGGTGFKSIGGVTTVNNDLNINSGALLDVVASNFTVNGSSTIAGNLQDNNAAAGTTTLQNLNLSGGTINGTQTGVLNINGNLTMPDGNGTIGRVALTVSGTTTVGATRSLTLNNDNGIKTFIGLVTVDGTFSSSSVITAGNLVFRGGITNNNASGTFTTNVTTFNTNNQNLSGAGAFNFGGAVTITGAITVTNQSSHVNGVTIAGILNGSVAGSTYANAANALTNYQSATQPMAIGVLTTTASGSIFRYNGALAQAIKTTTYDNLTIAGGGSFTKTTSAAIIVNNNLSIEANSVFNPGIYNITVNDSTIINGTFNDNSNTGINTFAGAVINSGTWTSTTITTEANLIFQNGFTNNSVTNAAFGASTFSTNNQALAGTGSITFANPVVVSGAITLTNNCTNSSGVTFNSTIDGTIAGSTLANGINAIINYQPAVATPPMNTGSLDGTASGNTFNYNRNNAQTVKAATYHNLGILNGNTKSLSGATIVNGNLSIESPTTLDITASNYALSVGGNWSNAGTFNSRNGAVTFNGSVSQSITPNTSNFYDVVFNNTANGTSAIVLNADVTITNAAALTDGIISTGANRLILSNNSAASLSGGSADSYVNGNLRRNIATNTSTYAFPVGSSANYFRADIKNNNLTGITYIDAAYSALARHDDTDLDVNDGPTLTYVSIASNMWTIDPNTAPSGGSYDVYLYTENVSGLIDNEFAVVKRPTGSPDGTSWTTGGGTINAGGGDGRKLADGYALRMGLTSFSEFGIGSTTPSNPLPIQLVSFNVKINKTCIADLTWVTATEVNNDFFTIERSVDGVNFEEVKTIKGAGNSSRTLTYKTTDARPLKGVSYYRLKQTDYDGTYTYSGIVSLTNNGLVTTASIAQSWTVFPNPMNVGGFMNVYTENFQAKATVTVYEATTGKQVAGVTIESENTSLPLEESLKPGIYIVKIVSGETATSKRIIIQ